MNYWVILSDLPVIGLSKFLCQVRGSLRRVSACTKLDVPCYKNLVTLLIQDVDSDDFLIVRTTYANLIQKEGRGLNIYPRSIGQAIHPWSKLLRLSE